MEHKPYPFQAPGRLVDFMRQADQAQLINLAAGVPAPETLPYEDLRTACDRALNLTQHSAFAYHHPEGDLGLRAWIAERMKPRGLSLTGQNIIITTGCTQALHLMLSCLVHTGDVVAIEEPAYYGMLEILAQRQAHVLPIPYRNGNEFDLDHFTSLAKKHSPKLLVICSALSNPSGRTIPAEQRQPLVEFCRHHQIAILEDEIYGDLYDGPPLFPLRAYDDGSTVSYVTSFSKTISPGLRVGYAIPGKLHEACAALKCQTDLHGSVLSEITLREYLHASHFPHHLETLHRHYRHRRQLATETIQTYFPAGTQLQVPAGGFLLWPVLPKPVALTEIRQKALTQRIAFAHGQVFYTRTVPHQTLRLNCARATEPDLISGLKTLGQLLSEYF